MHHAYSKHAEVTVPSLDDWEKNWKTQKPQMLKAEIKMPALVQVDFEGQAATVAGTESEAPAVMACQAGGWKKSGI